jgi:hypothetical protein
MPGKCGRSAVGGVRHGRGWVGGWVLPCEAGHAPPPAAAAGLCSMHVWGRLTIQDTWRRVPRGHATLSLGGRPPGSFIQPRAELQVAAPWTIHCTAFRLQSFHTPHCCPSAVVPPLPNPALQRGPQQPWQRLSAADAWAPAPVSAAAAALADRRSSGLAPPACARWPTPPASSSAAAGIAPAALPLAWSARSQRLSDPQVRGSAAGRAGRAARAPGLHGRPGPGSLAVLWEKTCN